LRKQQIGKGSAPRIYRGARWWPPEFARQSSLNRLEEMVAWERQTLAGRYALLDRPSLVNSPVGLKNAQYEALLDTVQRPGSSEIERAALQRLGVDYLIVPDDSSPEHAERIMGEHFPDGAALWRIQDFPGSGPERLEHRFQPLALHRGAAVSGASWIVLAVAAVIGWSRRKRPSGVKSSNSAPA
jgi:hypothetical protein